MMIVGILAGDRHAHLQVRDDLEEADLRRGQRPVRRYAVRPQRGHQDRSQSSCSICTMSHRARPASNSHYSHTGWIVFIEPWERRRQLTRPANDKRSCPRDGLSPAPIHSSIDGVAVLPSITFFVTVTALHTTQPANATITINLHKLEQHFELYALLRTSRRSAQRVHRGIQCGGRQACT